MRIVQVGNNKYIDKDLFDYINNIWVNFDVEIEKDSNIYFAKNTTVNRLITDYCGKNISRVIKKEKADYVVINKFNIGSFPQYYNGVNITDDDTQEVVYGIYNRSCEEQDTVELILDFITRGQEVKYTNQDRLNESLNNGFVIDRENYITIKELVDSQFSDNHQLAVNMLINSDLKANYEWLLYIYHKKPSLITNYDKKNIIYNYLTALNLGYNNGTLLESVDAAMSVVKNPDVRIRFEYLIRKKFEDGFKGYLATLGSQKFELEDFKIKYVQ